MATLPAVAANQVLYDAAQSNAAPDAGGWLAKGMIGATETVTPLA